MKDWRRGLINDAETQTQEGDKLSPWKLQAKNLWRLVEIKGRPAEKGAQS